MDPTAQDTNQSLDEKVRTGDLPYAPADLPPLPPLPSSPSPALLPSLPPLPPLPLTESTPSALRASPSNLEGEKEGVLGVDLSGAGLPIPPLTDWEKETTADMPPPPPINLPEPELTPPPTTSNAIMGGESTPQGGGTGGPAMNRGKGSKIGLVVGVVAIVAVIGAVAGGTIFVNRRLAQVETQETRVSASLGEGCGVACNVNNNDICSTWGLICGEEFPGSGFGECWGTKCEEERGGEPCNVLGEKRCVGTRADECVTNDGVSPIRIWGVIRSYDSEQQCRQEWLGEGGGGNGSVCGDGACTGTETFQSCPADCGSGPGTCGDGACNNGETNASCPADCPSGGGGSTSSGSTSSGGGSTPAPFCADIKAYQKVGEAWEERTENQLGNRIKLGDVIKFAVKGASGAFEKARFIINGETFQTTQREGEYYVYEYTVTESGRIRVKGEVFER